MEDTELQEVKLGPWPHVYIQDVKIEFVPWADAPGISYIRIERWNGDYLGSIDSRVRLDKLKHFRRAINGFIRAKTKRAPKRKKL